MLREGSAAASFVPGEDLHGPCFRDNICRRLYGAALLSPAAPAPRCRQQSPRRNRLTFCLQRAGEFLSWRLGQAALAPAPVYNGHLVLGLSRW